MMIKRLILMVPALVVPIAILVGVKAYLAFAADPSFTGLIDNPTTDSVAVTVDGEAVGSVAPNSSLTVEVEPGTHQLVATGSAGVVEQGSFSFAEAGDFAQMCGVYNLSGGGRYADVTVYYANDANSSRPPTISPAGEGQRFFVTNSAFCELDRGFEDVITTSSALSVTSVTHLCHVGDDRSPLHDVSKLAYIAGPTITAKQIERVRVEGLDGQAARSRSLREEQRGQWCDFICPVAKRWNFDRDGVEAIEEIEPEVPRFGHGLEIFVGGRDDSHVN